MIIGHGIDIEEIDRIRQAYEKNPSFAKRVLTDKEWLLFSNLSPVKRQMSFLAGRWAAKEAFSKAMGTGIGKLGFHDVEILMTEKGAPYVTKSPFREGVVLVSISHTDTLVQASVILTEK